MPRIDPQQLLKTLGILLSPSGGIKSSEEVDRLVKLMSKFSRKLVSKCIYVQILKATPSELLSKFLVEGGWQLLNTWFDDAIKSHNWPLVREMLHLFQFCPMTAELLKENANEHQAPKLINQLRQEASIQADIRGLALDIYKSWVAVVSQPPIKTIEQSQPLPDFDSDSNDEGIDTKKTITPRHHRKKIIIGIGIGTRIVTGIGITTQVHPKEIQEIPKIQNQIVIKRAFL